MTTTKTAYWVQIPFHGVATFRITDASDEQAAIRAAQDAMKENGLKYAEGVDAVDAASATVTVDKDW